MMCSEYLSIVDGSQVLEKKTLSSLAPKTMGKEYFSAQYDPQDPKSFFEQMEFAYQYALSYYDQIEHHEMSFRSDDWKNIRLYHDALENIHSQMRVVKWQNFGLK